MATERASSVDLYVYYRVRDEDADALLPRIRALQQQLALAHGAAPQLKRRPASCNGAQDGVQTWMEVYPAVPAGFTAALDEAIAVSGIAPLLVGPRHTEVFTDIPCA